MLSKKYRLPGYEIKNTLRNGRRMTTEFFQISHIPHQEPPRFAVICPSRVGKKAVERNRMKRLTHEAIWKLVKENKISGDYVFMARGNFTEKKLKEVFEDISRIIY